MLFPDAKSEEPSYNGNMNEVEWQYIRIAPIWILRVIGAFVIWLLGFFLIVKGLTRIGDWEILLGSCFLILGCGSVYLAGYISA